MRHCEIRRRRFHSGRVILSHIGRTPTSVVSHEQRTTIDVEIRAHVANRRLVDLMTIERAANRLRYAMGHRLALSLLGQIGLTLAQDFFRLLAFREVSPDSLHADRVAVTEDQTRAHFEPDSFALLRDDVDFVNGRNTLTRLLGHHLYREA